MSSTIRVLVAVTIPFASPAFAAELPTTGFNVETATGGGGNKPPNLPPVTYSDGPGLDPQRGTGDSFGGPKYRGTAGTFMEIWSVEHDGTKVYREGLLDKEGRVRVFKYSSNPEFVHRGYIKIDPTHPDGLRATFPAKWGDRFVNLQREVMLASQPQPVAELTTKIETKVAQGPTGNLLDGYNAPANGGTFKVYFQGRLDAQGRELIFRPDTRAGFANPQYMRVGFMNADGTVTFTETVPTDKLIEELRSNKVNDGRMGWGQTQRELFTQRLQSFSQYTLQDWTARMSAQTEIQTRLVSPHSRYAEIQAPKDPLPRNRSLVVVEGQGPQNVPRTAKVGPAGSTVGVVEYLPEMDPQYRPSALRRGLRMAADEHARWQQNIQRFARGRPNELIGNGSKPGPSTFESMKTTGIEMGRGVAGFYIAMGIMAGAMLMIDYPDNPAAWQSYIESSTDPMGIAQLGGFMAAAGLTYWGGKRLAVKAFGPTGPEKFGVKGSLFMSSILVGAFAGTVIAEMMADPNSAKCLGHTAYGMVGQFTKDYAACDALWDKWSSNQHWNNMAVNQLMPMFANIMVAGGLYQAALLGTHYLLSRQAIAVALRSVRFGFSPAGGIWVKFGQIVTQAVLFLGAYYIADQVFGVGSWVQQFMTAEWSFSNDPHGNSIHDTKNKLLAEWKKLKDTKFANPNLIKNVCFDAGRKYNMFYDCDDPERLGPTGLILKHSEFQQQWRRIQMQDVQNSYNQWRKKSDNYYAMLELTYDFYKGAVERLAYENRTKAAGGELVESAAFGQAYLDGFVATQSSANSGAWQFIQDKTLAGHWKFVETSKVQDFLVTAIACGPEAEGYGEGSGNWWTGLTDWMSGNTAPGEVIDNPTGWEARFFGPRLVTPIDANRNTVCESGGVQPIIWTPMQPAIQLPPSKFMSKSPTGEYTNLFDYIRAEIRPSVLEGENNKFQPWWETNVTPGTVALEKEFRSDYQKMLNTEYLHTLTKKDYYWCGPTTVGNSPLKAGFEYLLPLMAKQGEPCPADATHRLANGVLNSLRDEMRLYFAMLIDLYLSNRTELGTRPWPGSVHAAQTESVAKANEILALLDQLIASATEMDASKRANLEEIGAKYQELATKSKLEYLLRPAFKPTALPPDERNGQPQADPAPPKNPHLEEWSYLLNLKIDGVFLEALMLYKVLATFER